MLIPLDQTLSRYSDEEFAELRRMAKNFKLWIKAEAKQALRSFGPGVYAALRAIYKARRMAVAAWFAEQDGSYSSYTYVIDGFRIEFRIAKWEFRVEMIRTVQPDEPTSAGGSFTLMIGKLERKYDFDKEHFYHCSGVRDPQTCGVHDAQRIRLVSDLLEATSRSLAFFETLIYTAGDVGRCLAITRSDVETHFAPEPTGSRGRSAALDGLSFGVAYDAPLPTRASLFSEGGDDNVQDGLSAGGVFGGLHIAGPDPYDLLDHVGCSLPPPQDAGTVLQRPDVQGDGVLRHVGPALGGTIPCGDGKVIVPTLVRMITDVVDTRFAWTAGASTTSDAAPEIADTVGALGGAISASQNKTSTVRAEDAPALPPQTRKATARHGDVVLQSGHGLIERWPEASAKPLHRLGRRGRHDSGVESLEDVIARCTERPGPGKVKTFDPMPSLEGRSTWPALRRARPGWIFSGVNAKGRETDLSSGRGSVERSAPQRATEIRRRQRELSDGDNHIAG